MPKRLLRNIVFWLSINHFERIKTFGFFKHISYVFNFNISRIVINMQANLTHLPKLIFPKGYSIREMDTENPDEISEWIRIVNQSYPDADENEASFKKHLYRHPFLNAIKIFFITSENIPVGTVSAGIYRKNPNYGGDARIAILPSEQGHGLGLFAINYAFHYLKKQGINYGETIISIKRTQSIILHLKCGFRPQFDRSKTMFDIQKRMWPARFFAKRKLKKLTKAYLLKSHKQIQ